MKTWILFALCLLGSLPTFAKTVSADLAITARDFSALTEVQFNKLVSAAREQKIKTITIEPEAAITKVSASYPGGDFYFLVGAGDKNNDEKIRSSDFLVSYGLIRYLGELRYKIVINLFATINDFKDALGATKPTIIFWASHGDEEGFYDASGDLVPYDIFRFASPSVYQFILTSCYGKIAMKRFYEKHVPKSMEYWSWMDIVYHPQDVKKFFLSGEWSPFMNRPTIYNEGLYCDNSGRSWQIRSQKTGKFITLENFERVPDCYRRILKAQNGFVCLRDRGNKYQTYNINTLSLTPGIPYEDLDDCNQRISTSHGGKICRRLDNNRVYMINSKTNKPEKKEFLNMDQCVNYLFSTQEI